MRISAIRATMYRMVDEQLQRRHEQLLARLRDVAAAHGHDPARLRIVGVTKSHPVETAAAAFSAGIRILGESRVQEAEPKIAAVPDAEWHLIGRLQANKVRRAVRAFAAIHSVDSEELLERIRRIADEEGRHPQLLVEVNVSGEAAKAGMSPEALRTLTVPRGSDIVGLMTIAPMGVPDDLARRQFRALRELRDELSQRLGRALPELSMGMSADAEAAAAEGATLVRIGTALFGARP